MFRRIRWRIAIPFVILNALVMGVLGVYLVGHVREARVDSLRAHLTGQARLAASILRPYLSSEAMDIDSAVKSMKDQIDGRLTIIAPDGTVLGDSEELPEVMETMPCALSSVTISATVLPVQ